MVILKVMADVGDVQFDLCGKFTRIYLWVINQISSSGPQNQGATEAHVA